MWKLPQDQYHCRAANLMFISLKVLFQDRINTGNVMSVKNEEIRRKNRDKEGVSNNLNRKTLSFSGSNRCESSCGRKWKNKVLIV